KNGQVFFGGSNGFNIIDPAGIPENRNIPKILLTDLQLFNKPVKIGEANSPLKQSLVKTKEITLTHTQSVFTIEFAGLSYTIPEKTNYAYMLVGFDKDWNYTTERKVTYTNLNPGVYTFRVKAANNDGYWNEEGVSLKIIIKPPFWLTWWFKTLALLIICGGIYGFYRYRIHAVEKQKQELKKQVYERTEEIFRQSEQLQSMNEELQSQSEELQSQSEHLQVLNEELFEQKEQERRSREEAEL